MDKFWVFRVIFTLTIITQTFTDFTYHVMSKDLMKCSYGERGSLTATCVNATPSYFKSTLYKFDHLDETVQCVNCNLTSIEPNTFDLSGNHINTLNISECMIESLKPKAFMGLIFLKYLDMGNNKIKSVYPGTFNGAKKIETIDLSRNEITILNESGFAELFNLKKLILYNNSISVIAEKAFTGLTSLQELDLGYNQITDLKNVVSNLTSLQILKLNNNKLKTINETEFYNLTNLDLLCLDHNFLTSPIIELSPNNQLRKISLIENTIDTFWVILERAYALEELNLRGNNISGISAVPGINFPSLRDLDLSRNSIKSFQTHQFTGLPQLRYLNISHNVIEDVRITGTMSIPSLHTLDLSYNNISDLDYLLLISRTPSLSYLKLENNLLSCYLEEEMAREFAEDNFKFVLFENSEGSVKCLDKPVSSNIQKAKKDLYVSQDSDSITAGNIVILVLLSFVIVAVGILFYVQYLFYKGVRISLGGRVESNLQLINPDSERDHEMGHGDEEILSRS